MTKQVYALRTALGYAREKLELYRAQHSGVYVGGIEYTALMRMIDEALRLPDDRVGRGV